MKQSLLFPYIKNSGAATSPAVGGTSRAAYRDNQAQGQAATQSAALLDIFRTATGGLTTSEAAFLLMAHHNIGKTSSNVSSLLNDMNKKHILCLDRQDKTPYYLFVKTGEKRPNQRPPHRLMEVWHYHGALRGDKN